VLPTQNLVKDERCDLLADPHKIRWKNNFCQLLNVYGMGSVRQTQMQTAESYVPQPSASKVQIATEKLKRYKLQSIHQIPAELNQAGGEHCILRFINLLSLSGTKNCLTSKTSQLLYLFTKKII
jgi:hypothetical protein